MKIKTSIVAITASLVSCVLFAHPCPTEKQLKDEWSLNALKNIEQFDKEIVFYQEPHKYGTDVDWYVTFSIHEKDISVAREKAIQAIQQAELLGGGISPIGFYSCGYMSNEGVMIYAFANIRI